MFGGAVIAKWSTRGWVANAELQEDVTKRFIERMKPERLVRYGVCGLDPGPSFL